MTFSTTKYENTLIIKLLTSNKITEGLTAIKIILEKSIAVLMHNTFLTVNHTAAKFKLIIYFLCAIN